MGGVVGGGGEEGTERGEGRGEGRGERVGGGGRGRGRDVVVPSIPPRPTPRALKIFRENGEAYKKNNKMTFCFNPGRGRGSWSVAKRRR